MGSIGMLVASLATILGLWFGLAGPDSSPVDPPQVTDGPGRGPVDGRGDGPDIGREAGRR